MKIVTPAIQEIIDKQELPGDVNRILVPGCGVGYDAIALTKQGARVIGLDLSHSAIQLANKVISTHRASVMDHLMMKGMCNS